MVIKTIRKIANFFGFVAHTFGFGIIEENLQLFITPFIPVKREVTLQFPDVQNYEFEIFKKIFLNFSIIVGSFFLSATVLKNK